MIDFGGKRCGFSSLIAWVQSQQGKMKNLAAELKPVLQDLRKQKVTQILITINVLFKLMY